jgi:serine protease AprX
VILILIGITALSPVIAVSGSPNRDFRSRLMQIQSKVSSPLFEEMAFIQNHPEYDYNIPVIVRFNQDFDVGSIPTENTANRYLKSINGVITHLEGRQLLKLAESNLVDFISIDSPIFPMGEISMETSFENGNVYLQTIGAERASSIGNDGEGVVVALFDSGIGYHPDIKPNRILTSVDFTDEKTVYRLRNHDSLGHGTAMAGIIGGTGKASNGSFRGLASRVSFIDLKVIGENGTGSVGSVIRAIDWVIENREKYGIRLANFSIGKPPTESFKDDLLCQAVSRLLENKIISVVSAGNLGRTESYPEIWGSITSPGIHPGVVTVAAIDTGQSLTHQDDLATPFASRGPTFIDGFFKPDLVAPGYKVPVPVPKHSFLKSEMADSQLASYPDYYRMSGSSVATAFVTGTAALMLGANPEITPNLARVFLMQTAIKLTEPHMLEQGNGLVNALSAVDFSYSVDVHKRELWKPPITNWEMDSETVWIGDAIVMGQFLLAGPFIRQESIDLWGSGLNWKEQVIEQESLYLSALKHGMLWTDSLLWTDSILYSDSTLWTDALLWTDSILWTDTLVWTNSERGLLWTDSNRALLWTDGLLWTDWAEIQPVPYLVRYSRKDEF